MSWLPHSPDLPNAVGISSILWFIWSFIHFLLMVSSCLPSVLTAQFPLFVRFLRFVWLTVPCVCPFPLFTLLFPMFHSVCSSHEEWANKERKQGRRKDSEQGKGPLSTGTGPVHLSHSSSVHSSLLRSPHCHSHRRWLVTPPLTGITSPLTGHSAFDWLTLLTAVLADKPLGRQRPLTTGPKDVTGL